MVSREFEYYGKGSYRSDRVPYPVHIQRTKKHNVGQGKSERNRQRDLARKIQSGRVDMFSIPIKDIPEMPAITENVRYKRVTYSSKSHRRIFASGTELELADYLVEVEDPLEGLFTFAEYAEMTKASIDNPLEVYVLSGEGKIHYERMRRKNPNASLHFYSGMSMATLGACLFPSVVIPKT